LQWLIAHHWKENHGKHIRLCVDFDTILLAKNISSKDKIKVMIMMAINFANEGIDVGIVMDGPVHDDLECASMKRAADRERAQFRALFTKADQPKLQSQINDLPENFNLKEAQEEHKKLNGIAKKS
jgi:hypothetical protein